MSLSEKPRSDAERRRDAPTRTAYVTSSEAAVERVRGDGFVGVEQTTLIGSREHSVHQEVVITQLDAGGCIPGHFHPFEESFFILEGSVLYAIRGRTYQLRAGDFGFAPIGEPHSWLNNSGAKVRWLEIRVPQPKTIGEARGTYAAPRASADAGDREVEVPGPTCRLISHFDDADLPPYGPIVGRGIVNYSVKHISVRYLITEAMGAVQHLSFIAQLPPVQKSEREMRDEMERDPETKYHFHQYEEVYHFLQGRGLAYLDGRRFEVTAGDTILAGVGASHSVVNASDEPLRWIETQAPSPPSQDSMFFERDWLALKPIVLSTD